MALGHDSTIRPAQADMVESGLRWGIEGGQRLRPWAIRQAVAIGSWIMSWSDGDGLPDDGAAQPILGNGLSRLSLRQDGAPVDQHDDSPKAKVPWIRFVQSPTVVILSVAAIAQFCWRSTRRRKLRRGLRQVASNRADEGSPPDQRPDMIGAIPWSRITLVARPLFHRSRAV
jgi:hypothetical protein